MPIFVVELEEELAAMQMRIKQIWSWENWQKIPGHVRQLHRGNLTTIKAKDELDAYVKMQAQLEELNP